MAGDVELRHAEHRRGQVIIEVPSGDRIEQLRVRILQRAVLRPRPEQFCVVGSMLSAHAHIVNAPVSPSILG